MKRLVCWFLFETSWGDKFLALVEKYTGFGVLPLDVVDAQLGFAHHTPTQLEMWLDIRSFPVYAIEIAGLAWLQQAIASIEQLPH